MRYFSDKYVNAEHVGDFVVIDGPNARPICILNDENLSDKQKNIYKQKAIFAVIVSSDFIGAKEFKYARKALGLTESDFSTELGITYKSLVEIESSESVPVDLKNHLALIGLLTLKLTALGVL